MNVEIRSLMTRRSLLQAHLGEALGLSQASVADRLNGRREWRLAELRVLAELFDVPVSQLVDPPVPVAEAGHAAVRLLWALALVFVVAAGLPPHAGVTLLAAVALYVLVVRLFTAAADAERLAQVEREGP